MECKRVQEMLLTDYTDGEISREGQTAINRHLTACPRCAKFMQDIRQNITEPINAIGVMPAPANLYDTLLVQIAQKSDPTKTFKLDRIFSYFFPPRPAFLLAAAFITVFSFYYGMKAERTEFLITDSDSEYFSYVYEGIDQKTNYLEDSLFSLENI